MTSKWLQVKGDPSVRKFLFSQTRQTSLFDENIDTIHQIMTTLLLEKGVFHIKAHYSSSQLTCWFIDDPFNYQVYVKEEILMKDFLENFPTVKYENRVVLIDKNQIIPALNEFKKLRFTDEQVYLRAASMNRINGMIGMNFSCDGSHYIDYEEFFKKLDKFG